MEWDKEAATEFTGLCLVKGALEDTRLFAEKLARKNGRNRVTLEDARQTKAICYGSYSEELRQKELARRVTEGESDLRERMVKEAGDILTRDIDLFNIRLCHAAEFYCRFQLCDVRELKNEIAQELRSLRVSEMIIDSARDNTRSVPHHRFAVSISGCPRGCSSPETTAFGISGVSRPVVTGETCSECLACASACGQDAISVASGKPRINTLRCDCCASCVKACPTGKLAVEGTRFRITVGGRFGRYHRVGYELFRIADKLTLMKALGASVATIKEDSGGYEDLSRVVSRVGVAPIFQRIYQDSKT